jgi:hypothetical protein
MEAVGLNWGYLLVQLFILILLAGWFILAIVVLFQLRRRKLPETARAIWAVVILVVPIVGAVAFWIVRPGRDGDQD